MPLNPPSLSLWYVVLDLVWVFLPLFRPTHAKPHSRRLLGQEIPVQPKEPLKKSCIQGLGSCRIQAYLSSIQHKTWKIPPPSPPLPPPRIGLLHSISNDLYWINSGP